MRNQKRETENHSKNKSELEEAQRNIDTAENTVRDIEDNKIR